MIETKSSKPVPKPRAGVRKSAVRVCGQERPAGLSWGFSWAPHPYTSPGWWGEPRRGPGACPAAGTAGLCLCQSCCGVEASPGSRRAGRGGNSPGGMGLKCPAGSSTACTCKPCRAAVRSIGELQYGIPHSQNQPRRAAEEQGLLHKPLPSFNVSFCLCSACSPRSGAAPSRHPLLLLSHLYNTPPLLPAAAVC